LDYDPETTSLGMSLSLPRALGIRIPVSRVVRRAGQIGAVSLASYLASKGFYVEGAALTVMVSAMMIPDGGRKTVVSARMPDGEQKFIDITDDAGAVAAAIHDIESSAMMPDTEKKVAVEVADDDATTAIQDEAVTPGSPDE
jgi:hypothetical protein